MNLIRKYKFPWTADFIIEMLNNFYLEIFSFIYYDLREGCINCINVDTRKQMVMLRVKFHDENIHEAMSKLSR